MATGKHYCTEENAEGKFAVRAASSRHDSQEEALAEAEKLNPEDHRNVERARNVASSRRVQWTSAR